MKSKRHIAVSCLWLAAVGTLLLTCTKKTAEPVVPLPVTVSFQRDIIPLFSANCSTAGCHVGPTLAGNLNLSPTVAYSQLWKRGLLDTLHADQSALYIQMNATSDPMPPTGRLPNGSLALVLRWIQQKAPNN